jgi:hypothetical protein
MLCTVGLSCKQDGWQKVKVFLIEQPSRSRTGKQSRQGNRSNTRDTSSYCDRFVEFLKGLQIRALTVCELPFLI